MKTIGGRPLNARTTKPHETEQGIHKQNEAQKKSVKATKLGQIMRQKSHNGPKDQRSENQHLTSEGEHLYLFNSVL